MQVAAVRLFKRGLSKQQEINETFICKSRRPFLVSILNFNFINYKKVTFAPVDHNGGTHVQGLSCKIGEIDSLAQEDREDPYGTYSITLEDDVERLPFICLDAAALGDIPARYTISCVHEYEFPTIGVYVDPRIVPGFRYKVRILPELSQCSQKDKSKLCPKASHLFSRKALTLQSIGRGYCRRLVFEPFPDNLNDNENYFWSDSHPGGFALEVDVLSEGDQFFAVDEKEGVIGLVEVFDIVGSQKEISQMVNDDAVTKEVEVTFHCKTERRHFTKETSFTVINGVVECQKKKGARKATVKKIHSLFLCGNKMDGLTLLPLQVK